ncbi:MAG: hypothetical protein QOI58_208 [Thermoanaerobaculia bacterium]|jgi:tetratricopeptide (TPR) repeat protein|nr:hypothetical protein [Thermoanaerobaculia bacterium]
MADFFLRILVSSRSDLPDERIAAFDAISEAGHDPDRYEDWPALSQRPLDASIAAVKRDDILVLLLGATYGLLTETGRSITHEEYLAAREKNIPVLAFLVGSGDPEPAQAELIAEVEKNQTIRPVASIDALKSEIKKALSAEVARGYREQRDAPLDTQIRTSGISVDRRMAITIDAQAEVIDSLRGAITRQAAEKLNAARTAFREGRPNDAIAMLDELRREAAWNQIDRDVRARALSTLASFRRATGSTADDVEPLLQDAKKIDPDADRSYFDALQNFEANGPVNTLEVLSVVRNTRTLNLKAALLLEVGQIDEAANLIEQPPEGVDSDVETERLRGFVEFARGDVEGAISILEATVNREPRSYALRVALAIAKIASTIAPAERPTQPGAWPPPVDPAFVAASSDMLARLDDAAATLGEVIGNTQWTGMPLEQARGWRLAALALHPERREAARAFARQLLELDPADSAALVWSNAFGFDVDVEKAEAVLSSETASPVNASRVIAVIAAVEHTQAFARAESLLDQHRAAFDDEPDLWHFWKARLLMDRGQFEKAEELIPSINRAELRETCELMLSESRAKANGDWNDFVRLADRLDPGYRPLAIRARLGRWNEIVDQALLLAEQAPSPASVSLATTALFHVRRNHESLAILDRHRGLWSRSPRAIQMQRMQLRNQLVLGQLQEALKGAEKLFQRTGSSSDLLMTIHAAISAGRWKDARFWASRLLDIDAGDVSAADVFRTAQTIMIEDRELARELWKRAAKNGVANEILPLAIRLAMALGLVDEAAELTQSAMGTGVLREATAEEFAIAQNELKANIGAAIQAYARAEMPLAFLLAATGRPLADVFDKQLATGGDGAVGSVQPLYVRHGGRMLSHHLSLAGVTSLTIDVSTILLSDALGVLDAIEKRFESLRISSVTCAALAEQETLLHAAIAANTDDAEKQRLERLVTRLSKLASRIGAGLSSGKYVAFATASATGEDVDLDLTSQALADFFLASDQPNHAFVVDDRFASSRLTLHGSNVVTLLNVLAALRESAHLEEDGYFRILLRLRRANFRFIDLTGDEIVHWLTKAKWNDGELQESEPLQVMRVYINSALSDRNLRVIPIPASTPDHAFGEGPFALNSSFAPVQALSTLWSLTEFTIEQLTAMSDWILHNLYTGSFGVQHLYGKGFNAARDLMLNDVAGLLTMFFDLDLTIGRAFGDWVQSRIAMHRLDADPELFPDLIAAIKQQLLHMLTLADGDLGRKIIRAVFAVLPSGIRKEIALDATFTTKVQLRGRASIRITGFEFLEEDFWKAIARLRKRSSVSLRTNAAERIRVSRAPGDAGLYFDLGKQRHIYPNESFVRLAFEKDGELRSYLRSHPEIFDVNDQALNAAIEELLALPTAKERNERYRERAANSAAVHYAGLRELFGQANHTFSDLMPGSDALLRHYFPGFNSRTDLDAAAAFEPLIERADLLDVLRRAIVMPIGLPGRLVARFTAESEACRGHILAELREEVGSPVARAHVAVLGFASGTEADQQLALTMIDELAGSKSAAKETKLFMTVLRFVYWRLSRISSLADAPRLLLAWAHAGRLLGIFVATKSDIDQLHDSFVDAGMQYPNDYWTRTASSRDVLHPFTATGLRTVAASLAHVAAVVSNKNDAIEVGSKLEKLIYPNGTAIAFPFLRDSGLGTNVSHSFLDTDLSDPLVEVNEAGAALLTSMARDEILSRAMQKIDEDPESDTAWQFIDAFIGNLPPPPTIHAGLEEVARGPKLDAIAESDTAIRAFTVLSNLQIHFGDDYRGRVEDLAVAALTHWQKRERDAKATAEDVNRWSFIAMALAARPESREDTGSALGRIFRRFIDAAPEIAPMLSVLLSRMPFQLPMDYLLPLWPAVIAVRAMPQVGMSRRL